MYAFAAAFIRPGDEVILFEPYFDQYTAQVKFKYVLFEFAFRILLIRFL